MIGPGRAGVGLALALRRAGILVLGLHGRRRKQLPRGLTLSVGEVPPWLARADIVLLAVRDDSLVPLVRTLALGTMRRGQIVLHLSGAQTSRVLAPLRRRGALVGSMHPLMTVAREPGEARARLTGATFALEGDPAAVRAGRRLAKALGGVPATVRAEQRPRYHAGAVFASNYVVAVLSVAEDLLVASGLERRRARAALARLATASVESSAALGPAAALTGPISRGDTRTIRRHLAALDPATRRLYAALGKRALGLARKAGLNPSSARAISRLL